MRDEDVAAIRLYHESTKHSWASVRQGPQQLDFDNMPLPFKVYPDLDPIPLPRDFETGSCPALTAIADPGWATTTGPLNRAALARLLFLSAGVVRQRRYPGGEISFRAAACTGALYHIDLYVVCGALAGVDAGVYHFSPHDFALRLLRAGDHRARLVAAAAGEPAIAAAPVVLVAASTWWRNAWKYRARAYRHAFWDTGTLLANVLALAAANNAAARVVTGFADDPVAELVGLDTAREGAIALIPLGNGAPPPPSPPPAPALTFATLPLSPHEIDQPTIRAAHTATRLDVAEIARWRHGTPPTLPAASDTPGVSVVATPGPPQRLEDVILRRGSARRFARTPIAREQLLTLVHAATRGIPADALAPVDLYLIVNGVEGMSPGSYAFDRTADELLPLRSGDLRGEAGHLDLGQELAADAAVNLYLLADLEPVFARLGPRGYRTVSLAAGIEGGKAYLAAYALGLGATGLTFFDDDVTTFFSPHAAGKSVLFLTAVGVRAR